MSALLDWVQGFGSDIKGRRGSGEMGGNMRGSSTEPWGMVGPESYCPAPALESQSLMQVASLLGLHVIVLKSWGSKRGANDIAQWQSTYLTGGSGEFGP